MLVQIRSKGVAHLNRVLVGSQYFGWSTESVGEAATPIVKIDVADLIIDADPVSAPCRLKPLSRAYSSLIVVLANVAERAELLEISHAAIEDDDRNARVNGEFDRVAERRGVRQSRGDAVRP